MKRLDRLKTLEFALNHWMTPCDDGFCSYTDSSGLVVANNVRARLRRQGKLPDPDTWRAVFIPADDGENAAFIRANPDGQFPWGKEKPSSPPADLNGKFDVVVFHKDHGIVDCAHYVSHCLTAGGVRIHQPGVPELVRTLRSFPVTVTRTLGLKVTQDQGERILGTGIVRPGDVIAFWEYTERLKRTEYHHSTIYVGLDSLPSQDAQAILNQNTSGKGTHRITCHSVCRFGKCFYDESWSLSAKSDARFTIIHFVDPADEIPSSAASLLDDWMAIDHAGQRDYYHFRADGQCEKSTDPPGAGRRPRVGPNDHGYWFVRDPFAVIFWPYLGQVDSFKIADLRFTPDQSMPGSVNEFSAKGTRLP
jgi:hypothetical protein